DELKQAHWELAKPHVKGLAQVVENELELDRAEQTIDQISDFIVISRSSRSYTFGGLVGKDMVWNSWAGMLLQNQETLEERIVMPPLPEVTILFERQSHTAQQSHHIKHSLRIALDVVEDQEATVKSLKQLIDYAVLDLKNQMEQQQRNLTAHRRAVHRTLYAVTPEETATTASTFDSVENIPEDDHSVGTQDGAVDRED
ncbi:hypothetical protein HDU80_001328, partial [Chytriomyces hyalinus]